MQLKKIGVIPSSLLASRRRLFQALERFFPVVFVGWEWSGCSPKVDGLLMVTLNGQQKSECLPPQSPVLVFTGFEPRSRTVSADQIEFTNVEMLASPLRNRCLVDRSKPQLKSFTIEDSDLVLASCRGMPIWVYRPTSAGMGLQFASSFPVDLGENEILSQHFNGERFIQLLPLFHFLQKLTVDIAWTPPPLRACIMIDDPNLHWPSYGHVKFRDLARHAERRGYHVAFATVPLDGSFAHPKAAAIFCARSEQLSLLIHGNNHTRSELAYNYTPVQKIAILAQAMRRIRRLEERTGVHIARVMAPPHGACSENMMSGMRRLGYEAACISVGSTQAWNPDRQWALVSFLEIAEMMGGGLPVLPRFRLDEHCETPLVIAAMLNQPLIPVAHQDGLSKGLELLMHVSQTINSLGNVKWTNMTDIVRSNFLTRKEGSLLRIRTYARHIVWTVPAGIDRVQVERAWDTEEGPYVIRNLTTKTIRSIEPYAEDPVVQFVAQAGESFALEIYPPDSINHQDVPPPPVRLWPLLRRLLTETRDRVSPLMQWTGGRCL